MQGLKNLIHRRRPTIQAQGLPGPVTNEAPPRAAAQPPEDAIDARDMARARAARTHVPRPEALAHDPFRPTMGERRLPAEDPQPDRINSPEGINRSNPPELPDPPELPGPARKIWDIEPPAAAPAAKVGTTGKAEVNSILAHCTEDPQAAAHPRSPRAMSQRTKTRLLGFHDDSGPEDVFATEPVVAGAAAPRFPIGWIVVLDGPGRGASFTLTTGLSTIGRDADQTITLDFGDTAISRQNHVAIAHDDEENHTYVGHGGKSNIVRHNDQPLLTTETLANGDTIRIGKTVLRFVALCGGGFSWGRARR